MLKSKTRLPANAAIGTAAAAGLGALALLALGNILRSRRAERRYPPKGDFIEIEGVRLHYLEYGEGPPVVFLHGNGVMAEDFEVAGLLKRTAAFHRVVAFDRPGFGYSARPRGRAWSAHRQAALIREALERLNVQRPVVVGHSWGTLVALDLALAYPEEVGALVLLSGYYFPSARADVALSAPNAVPFFGDFLNYTIAPVTGRLMAPKVLRKLFAPAAVPDDYAKALPLDLSLRPGQIRAASEDTVAMIPAAMTTMAHHHELAMPVFILAGDHDEIVSTPDQSERLASEIPHSILQVLPGIGHMIHHDAPKEVAAAIEAAARMADATRP